MATMDKSIQNVKTEMIQTYRRKNADYGNSFSELRRRLPIAVLVRLYDKYMRLRTLCVPGTMRAVADESTRDTLIDLANYACMEVAEHRASNDEMAAEGRRVDPDMTIAELFEDAVNTAAYRAQYVMGNEPDAMERTLSKVYSDYDRLESMYMERAAGRGYIVQGEIDGYLIDMAGRCMHAAASGRMYK